MNWFDASEVGLLLRSQSPGKNRLEIVGVRIDCERCTGLF